MRRYFQNCFLGGSPREKGWINKLNNSWTPFVLITLSILSFLVRYIENPVDCWCPAEFKSSMVHYTNNICWRSENLYIHSENHTEGISSIIKRMNHIDIPVFNKLTPLLFLIQAILFIFPGILMHIGESKFGFKRNKLHGLTDGYKHLSLKDRRNVGKQLSRYLNQWLNNRIIKGLPFGLLTILIVFVYTLYIINVTVQLIVIDKYIKHPEVMSYGTHLTQNLFVNKPDSRLQSPSFRKVFLCDFKIRKLTTLHHYGVQCISNINLIYEQMFAFLWVWLLFTCVITYCSFALKLVEVILPVFRTRYIKQYLHSEDIVIQNDNDVSRFANNILGEDGVTVLKGISDVSSEYLVRDAVINLWIFNTGERCVPLKELNPPMQESIQQSHIDTPSYKQGSWLSPSRDGGEEAIPLVEFENKL